ncbi:MAG: PfkB family carbohydrate kinase [Bifidobacteriaceae bacterium]|jgi:sugar/nucleoside kinase (ribokinase family)|nr:PfkB family carbohydrate kinase [Bifidobacteriaceae bacterium]
MSRVSGHALGRLIHTGQVLVDLALRVGALPARGGDALARSHLIRPGGGFNVMAAARRDGAAVVYTGGHGRGPFGDLARAALAAEGVALTAPPSPARDTGFSIALVDDAAERTFVSAPGAEFDASPAALAQAGAAPGDLVYVSGYSLANAAKWAALEAWLERLDPAVPLLVDASPLVGELPRAALGYLAGRGPAGRPVVWSLNLREAVALAGRPDLWAGAAGAAGGAGLGARLAAVLAPVASLAGGEAGGAGANLAAALALALGGAVVLRLGAQGALVAPAAPGPVAALPAHPVAAVDTNGAGDAHCGVVAAALLRGAPLVEAVARANVAAALAAAQAGPGTAPTGAEIDAAIGLR